MIEDIDIVREKRALLPDVILSWILHSTVVLFATIPTVIVADEHVINSHCEIEYLPFRDCGMKFNI